MITNSVNFFNTNKSDLFPGNCDMIIAVWQIGNPENIGQIIRMAHNVAARKVLFINEKDSFRESKIKKTAGFSFDQMNWEFGNYEKLLSLQEQNYKLVVLETCEGAKNIFTENLPDKLILLAGSESHGLPAQIIKSSNLKVYIPIPGECKSMNVSHALAVAAFEWYRQKST